MRCVLAVALNRALPVQMVRGVRHEVLAAARDDDLRRDHPRRQRRCPGLHPPPCRMTGVTLHTCTGMTLPE